MICNQQVIFCSCYFRKIVVYPVSVLYTKREESKLLLMIHEETFYSLLERTQTNSVKT